MSSTRLTINIDDVFSWGKNGKLCKFYASKTHFHNFLLLPSTYACHEPIKERNCKKLKMLNKLQETFPPFRVCAIL